MFNVNLTLTFDLGAISLKLMSGKDLPYAGQTG